jgi:hypothetical protein
VPAIYSYVVRYDSGFAPNPFYGFCTLATCKPGIRANAQVGDWIVGSGSANRSVQRGGHLVYAMRVTETMSFHRYSIDSRFEKKKPFRKGSRKQSCGDNIYFRKGNETKWSQRDSFHSNPDGSLHPRHVARDTGVDRVLISEDFVYFGGAGPKIPKALRDSSGRPLCKAGIGQSKFEDDALTQAFENWIQGISQGGYQGPPFEWLSLRK